MTVHPLLVAAEGCPYAQQAAVTHNQLPAAAKTDTAAAVDGQAAEPADSGPCQEEVLAGAHTREGE
jgi:hypothetical protein